MNEAGPAIDARGVGKRFGDVRAVDGLDLRVDAGHVHGLVGPNGAGKTTFLRILFGLVRRDEGEIEVLGAELPPTRTGTMPGIGGFVEEPRFYPYLSARRNLEVLTELDGRGRGEVETLLQTVGLEDRAGRKVGGFSSGMRQRLGLASALARSPRLLLLDEPAVGLDPSAARHVELLLRRHAAEGTTEAVVAMR